MELITNDQADEMLGYFKTLKITKSENSIYEISEMRTKDLKLLFKNEADALLERLKKYDQTLVLEIVKI